MNYTQTVTCTLWLALAAPRHIFQHKAKALRICRELKLLCTAADRLLCRRSAEWMIGSSLDASDALLDRHVAVKSCNTSVFRCCCDKRDPKCTLISRCVCSIDHNSFSP
mmetsp:Transcript_48093/g.113900  ORF Transcript_48093/g.113900 Transcript_48093/m.113900 type:complete len:109 (-) Transcript_48093:214-540(-)